MSDGLASLQQPGVAKVLQSRVGHGALSGWGIPVVLDAWAWALALVCVVAALLQLVLGLIFFLIGIVCTGLRFGENLHEKLIGDGEIVERRVHLRIFRANVKSLVRVELPRSRWLADPGRPVIRPVRSELTEVP